MKKFAILLALPILLITSCKKNQPVTDPPKDGSCTASVAGVENITIFPSDNPWNIDISNQPIDPYNDQIIAGIGAASLKADFGSGLWEGAPIGIPFVSV
ncbi:MAG: hypothetical protein ABI415_06670, partial [Flavitalea sp.]